MRFLAFDIEEPLPELKNPNAFATLRPWVDVGGIGRLTFRTLERHFQAEELATLARPGNFFDFTRYRPTIFNADGERHVTVPNIHIRYAKGPNNNDFIFLHLLEPHLNGEAYVRSIAKLLEKLGTERYCLVGGMYDLVPHTKPILVTGTATGEKTLNRFVTAIEFVIQMRKHRQIIAMLLERLKRGGGNIILASRLRKKVARIEAKMITHTHQALGPRRIRHRRTFQPRQGHCHAETGKKLASINLYHANTSFTTCPCTLVSRRSRPL